MSKLLNELQFHLNCYESEVIDKDDLKQAIQEIVWNFAEVYNVKLIPQR
jgi:hypothetical protein